MAVARQQNRPQSSKANLDVAMVLGAIVSVQVSAALAVKMFEQVGPAGGALLRTAFAGLILVAVVRPSISKLDRQGWLDVARYGLILGAMNTVFYVGISTVDLGTAVAIEFLGPLTVATITAQRARDRIWVAFAAIGILLLTRPWNAGVTDPIGVLWLLAAAALWGIYILASPRASRHLPGLQPVALAMLIAAAVPLIPGVIESGSELLDPDVLKIGLVVAIVGALIPYSLEQVALRNMAPSVFGVLMALEPAAAALAGLVFLTQDPGPLGWLGIVAVVAAGIGVTRANAARVQPEDDQVPAIP